MGTYSFDRNVDYVIVFHEFLFWSFQLIFFSVFDFFVDTGMWQSNE